MKKNRLSLILLSLCFLLIGYSSCTKDASYEIEPSLIIPDSTQVDILSNPGEANDFSSCDTTEATYSGFMVPLIVDKCLRCHSGNEPFGGVSLETYNGVKAVADAGRLYGALFWQSGYETMPQGEAQLPACDLANVRAWINAGAPDN